MSSKALQPVASWRFFVVVALLSLLFCALAWRITSLQVLAGDGGFEFLQDQGDARTIRFAEIPAHRGSITDRHGAPLAVSTPVISLWVNPRQIDGKTQAIQSLAVALKVKPRQLLARIEKSRTKHFLYLERHMKPADAREILALRLPGVYGEREYRRFYPAAEVAAHVVGITNVDDLGIEGMELAYNDY
jgi:cell division protein FtsI (penicillin-binding protein 3)